MTEAAKMFDPLTPSETEAASRAADADTASDKRPLVPVPDDAPPMRFKHPQHGAPVKVWPYRDSQGRLCGYAARFEFFRADGRPGKDVLPVSFCELGDGRRHWRAKGIPAPRPLYRLPELLAQPNAPILIVEGEKPADAAVALFPDHMPTTPMGGGKAPHLSDWSPVASRDVIVWPDNDEPGRTFAERVAQLCHEAGAASVRITRIPKTFPPKWDLADAPPKLWDNVRLRELLVAAEPWRPREPGRSTDPHVLAARIERDYKLRPDGLWYVDPDPEKPETHLCGPFKVLAETRDAEGNAWGVLLSWQDGDGRQHEWAMPRSLFGGDANEVWARLLDGGLYVAPGRKAREKLTAYLLAVSTPAMARCVSRTGWHDRVFVLPDTTFGDTAAERVLLQSVTTNDHAFRCAGTLQDWQRQVGRYCIDNSRLAFGVACAFAPPLIHATSSESGGVNLKGGSSIGKTAILIAVGSVWGGGGVKGYVRQWRATDNGLEGVAASHNDALLCLDELSQVDAKAAGAAAYMLSNGAGKSRASRNGAGRPPLEWRCWFLSTGELGIADKVAEDNRRRAAAGQQVRVVDVPADAGTGLGAFESLHGFPDGDAFARYLKDAARRFYGAPIRAYLPYVAEHLDRVAEAVQGHAREFEVSHCPDGADGQVKRVAARFGLVAAAGELATQLGILPWSKGEATNATAICFQAWLDERGGIGAAEVAAGIDQVLGFIASNGSSRFELWDGDGSGDGSAARTINRVGWRRKDDEGQWEYFVTVAGFREICAGHDAKLIARELVKRKLLVPDPDGKASRSFRVPGHGQLRLYHFPSTVLGSD